MKAYTALASRCAVKIVRSFRGQFLCASLLEYISSRVQLVPSSSHFRLDVSPRINTRHRDSSQTRQRSSTSAFHINHVRPARPVAAAVALTKLTHTELEKPSSVEDRGQTDRVSTPTRARLRRWRRPRHAARFAALLRS